MTISNEAKKDLKQWTRQCGDKLPSHLKASLNKIIEKHGGPSVVTADEVDETRDSIQYGHDDVDATTPEPEEVPDEPKSNADEEGGH